MSIQAFNQLNEQEIAQLLKAPAQITVLIAGADNKIDEKETDWGRKIVHFRSFSSESALHDYYEQVSESFEASVNELVEKYSVDGANLITKLSEELAQLNEVLPKIESNYASLLLKSWRSLAQKVAEASGGIWGFGRVNTEESKLLDLPMLDA